MGGSSYGTLFTITTWGESHGPAIGVVIDGCPAGLPLDKQDIQLYLERRRPKKEGFGTARREADRAEILSGVFKGKTTGTPISLIIKNENQRSGDYSNLKDCYRPGHADYTYDAKYGFRDYAGGGRSSGRETIGRVAGGAVASLLLKRLGVTLTAFTRSIGPIAVSDDEINLSQIPENALYMPNNARAKEAAAYLEACVKEHDSAGGIIECQVNGLPAGLGEPVFQKLDAALAGGVMSIGAVKGVEIGDGFKTAFAKGSENNDPFCSGKQGIYKASNHSGGTLGGLSDGSALILRAAIKPTPSISRPQQTVDVSGNPIELSVQGRHDPVIVPRAVVVVESMAALTLADFLMRNMSARLDSLIRFYSPNK